MPKTAWMNEIGKSGYNWSAGYVYEEFLTDLQGGNGIKIYREMSDNDPVIGACLFAIKQILREAKWTAKPSGKSPTARKNAEFLYDCMHGMSHAWNTMIMDVLSMLSYGWSWHEIVYKRVGSKIVWKKMPIRLQNSWDQWELDDNGSVLGLYQRPAPSYEQIYIPLGKSLLFRTELNGDNPEGRSVLRPAYRPWYFKKNLEEIEGIGAERDLAGLPVITTPESLDWDKDDSNVVAQLDYAKNLVSNLRRDEQDGVVKPAGWELELLASSGSRQFNTNEIIDRYDKRIAMVVLAQFIMLGMERTGSYALAQEQADMFRICLEGWMDCIADVFNRHAVPKLFAYNGIVDDELPYVTHTLIRKYTLKDLADFVNKLAACGALVIDDEIQEYLKEYARLKQFREVSKDAIE